jgi:hypothetical protein
MRENDGWDETNQGTLLSIHGNVTMKPPVQLIYANKNVKIKASRMLVPFLLSTHLLRPMEGVL